MGQFGLIAAAMIQPGSQIAPRGCIDIKIPPDTRSVLQMLALYKHYKCYGPCALYLMYLVFYVRHVRFKKIR